MNNKSNKNGFTLIEILSIITILSVITLLVMPNLGETLSSKKDREFEKVKELIQNAAKTYHIFNNEVYNIPVKQLVEEKYITLGENNEILDDCIRIVQDNDGFKLYKYVSCEITNVFFDIKLNGGVQETKYNGEYQASEKIYLEEPVKEGYEFKGWYLAKGNSFLKGNMLVMGDTETLIYATWERKVKFTIDYDGGISDKTYNEFYYIGDTLNLIKPNKEGYTFSGWKVVGDSIISGNYLTIGNDDVVIKAIWTPNIYNITYELNGGVINDDAPINVTYGTIIELIEPTRKGYKFTGWSSSNGFLNDNIFTPISSDVVLIANWQLDGFLAYETLQSLCVDSTTCSANNLLKDIDGNIRYYGSNPKNYISFNNEVWRIIGLFNVKTNTSTEELRLKIVKSEVLSSSKAFNSSNSNVWKGSYIESYLNGNTSSKYYYSLDMVAKSHIGSVIWNTGGVPYSVSMKPENVYTQEKKVQTAQSIVGLISLSDYGYAGGSKCTAIENSTCGNDNWLKTNNKYWTMTPSSEFTFISWYVDSLGLAYGDTVINANYVRPVVYLNADIRILGTGENTSEGIYKIVN